MTNENITNETNDVQGFASPFAPTAGRFAAVVPPLPVRGATLGFDAALGRPLTFSEFQVRQGAVERGERLRIEGDYSAMR